MFPQQTTNAKAGSLLSILSHPPRPVQPAKQMQKVRMACWVRFIAPILLMRVVGWAYSQDGRQPTFAMLRHAPSDPYTLTLAGMYIAIFGVPMLYTEYRLRRQMKMLRCGLAVTATVDAVRRIAGRICDVTYTFDAEGQVWTQTRRCSVDMVNGLKIGQTIDILYWPGRPQDTMTLINITLAELRPARAMR